MKNLRLLLIIVVAIAMLVMAIPAGVGATPATATVSGGSNAPYMIAVFSTPNEDSSTNPAIGPGCKARVQLFPIPCRPLFPPTDPNHDGWKMVKFYVLTADGNGDFVSDITTVNIQVNYPTATSGVAAGLTGYYIPGAEKFQLNATKNANGTWSANQAYPNMLDGTDPNPEYYPSVPFLSGNKGAYSHASSLGCPCLNAGYRQ